MPPPPAPPRASLLLGVLGLLGLMSAVPVLAQPTARAAAQAEQLFVQGLTRAYLGDFDAAVELYEQALARRPGEGAVYAALAEAHEARGDLPAALLYAERAATAAPAEPDVYRALARLQLVVGDPTAALAAQERVVALSPGDPDALSLLARTQHQVGRFEEALGTYERLLDLLGESPSIRARTLPILRRLGDSAGAAEALEAMLPFDPGNSGLSLELAEVYMELDRPLDAVRALEAALDAYPDDPDATLALAALYRRMGNETAAEALLPAGGGDGDSADPLVRAADLYARSGDDPEALRVVRDLLEALPSSGLPPHALLILGDLRFRDGDPSGAAEALAAALAADPAHPEAWMLLSAALLESGQAGAAADTVEEGLLLFPGQYPLLRTAMLAHFEAGSDREGLARAEEAMNVLAEEAPGERVERAFLLAHLGILHARAGDVARSEAAYAEALALAPDDPLVLNNYAYALATRGERLDEALRMARRAVDRYPDDPSLLDTLGWVYYARGEYDEAAEWLSRAVREAERQGTLSAVLLEHLGDAEAARGRPEEAARHWRSALRLDPSRSHLERKLHDLQ